jgi:glycosyltransferase involved in cell wall biosynthesis
MKILLCSHVFAPSIGGIETASAVLAQQFCRLGSTVTVVTQTPGEQVSLDYEVVRQPSLRSLLQLGGDADVIFQNNISLQTLLPLLPSRKPVVITHAGSVCRVDGTLGWREHLKLAVLRRCHNVAVSKAIGATIPIRTVIIGNPFQTEEFTELEDGPRIKDIVFLGRLVSQKGCDLALHALSILSKDGFHPSFTVIGDGAELPMLKRQTRELGLEQQVKFLGSLREGRGKEVAKHKIMVVPSSYAEPFGIVALEGLAAGCVVVASSAGGLPEAVGPCGILFPNGDAKAMASALRELLTDPALRERFLTEKNRHLERFQPKIIAQKYLNLFQTVLRK